MWQKILETVLSSIWQAVRGWFEAEEAESAKWAAAARQQQLESIKEGLAVEAAWRERVATTGRPTSAAEWNSMVRTVVALLACLSLTGCFRFYVVAERYQPVPPVIERPVLPEQPEFTERELQLADYAHRLEVGYEAVRQHFIEQNRKAGFPVPPQ